jgi:ferritin-like protein
MASETLHEPSEKLSPATVEMHRAITSLMEELEAIDWYTQRIDASGDAELRAILTHNRDEEKEHACLTLEWIRKHDPEFDTFLRRYLFRAESFSGDEEKKTTRAEPTLGLGSLRETRRR